MFEGEEGSQEALDYNGDLNSLLSDVESKLPELERLTKLRKKRYTTDGNYHSQSW